MIKSVRESSCKNMQSSFVFPKAGRTIRQTPVDFSFLRPLKPTIVFETYWRFAVERQRIFFKRVRNEASPWTEDTVLNEHKFTNAYRASDRTSQFLIRNVIYQGNRAFDETCFRILLFKFFNRIETWELLKSNFGEPSWATFKLHHYGEVLTKALQKGKCIYSAAYIMPSGGPKSVHQYKHHMHLHLLNQMMKDSLPSKIASARSVSAAFDLLKSYPTIGDFLAYQYATDINYSTVTNFAETDFVVAGPGAKDGVQKCFSDLGGLTESEVIKFICERQQECFAAIGTVFQSLWGRPLQLIDCQNLFCEVGKYARIVHPEFAGVTGRVRIKQKLKPRGALSEPWYPPKWGLNDLIKKEGIRVPLI